jgi:hypothetical protein
MTGRRRTALLTAMTILATAAACGTTPPGPGPATTSDAPPPNAKRLSFHDGISNNEHYRVEEDTADGASPDGHGHWHTRTARLVGDNDRTGDPMVIAAFNHASIAATQGLIDQARTEAADGARWTDEITPAVSFRPSAVSNVLVGVYYAVRGAHPVDYVATTVIDSRTAHPITLRNLFRDESAGLQRLSEQTKRIWPTVYGHGDTSPMPDLSGNEPREQNFANWIPTGAGMELHFADYQFGPGPTVITVPWPALIDVLAPDMDVLTR